MRFQIGRIFAGLGIYLVVSLSGFGLAQAQDADGDELLDKVDNCLFVANGPNDQTNPSEATSNHQTDADLDGFGNACDGDFDQDGGVTAADFGTFLGCYGQLLPGAVGPSADSDCAESDMNDDEKVDMADFDLFIGVFGNGLAGTSGLEGTAQNPGCADPTSNSAVCGRCVGSLGCSLTVVNIGLNSSQNPDCGYVPAAVARNGAGSSYDYCEGPKIYVDRTHQPGFQGTLTSIGTGEGLVSYGSGLFGFSELMLTDGYQVEEWNSDFSDLETSDARILMIPVPTIAEGAPISGCSILSETELGQLTDWVDDGGSLLLTIDHTPHTCAASLLNAFGLEIVPQSGALPPEEDPCPECLEQQTLSDIAFVPAPISPDETLSSVSPISNGSAGVVDEVVTYSGILVREQIPSSTLAYGLDHVLTFQGILPLTIGSQGVAFSYGDGTGDGRVYISGEHAFLTAQTRIGYDPVTGFPDLNSSEPYGLTVADNEIFTLNILRWLDQ